MGTHSLLKIRPRLIHRHSTTPESIHHRAPFSSSETEKKKNKDMTNGAAEDYDRSREVKDFDDSKIGVKGLVDSGITSIPRFFIHPPESLPSNPPPHISDDDDGIPIVDFSSVNSHRRSIIVDQIKEASRTWGFFQIINHDIPLDVLDRTISSIKAFNEQPTEIKSKYYTREMGKGVSFLSNVDLFQSKAASWRDTLQLRLGPTYPDLDQIPEICRTELVEWDQHVQRLGEILMGILCEGLGLESEKLKEMTCLEGRTLASHYYPYCPEPDRTVGLNSHSDPGVLTVLLQDQIGGLCVRKYGGEDWVEVKPLAGAIVINIGDLLQIISNDEYKSAEHRVVANRFQEPRVSAAVFFNPGRREDMYGPVPELISPEKPALYRQFTLSEFLRRFFTKGLDGKSLLDYFKL